MKALVTQRGILARSANMLTGKSLGQDVKEEDIPLPKFSKTEVLVKIRAVALNPIDHKFIDVLAPAGNIAGCDFAGVVEEMGQDAVGGWKVGDRVAGFVHFTSISIFIYAGSSSVGLFAIQMAKKAGFTVVTTASPHSFELVKRYGADHVFDYHSSTAAQDIATAHPNITRALDCFSEGKSTAFCAKILQKNGGKVVTLLDSKASIPGVEVKMIMSFQLLGRAFAWLPPIGPKFPASSTDREALARFYASLSELAQTIKPPPLTLVDGGFGGILAGLDRLRAKQVSGAKLVIKF